MSIDIPRCIVHYSSKKVKNKYCKAQDGNWCWSFM
jgi:hypothetical protein